MMSSSVSITETNSVRSLESVSKNGTKLGSDNQIEQVNLDQTRWKSKTQQLAYSTKLVEALRQVQRNSNSTDRSSVSNPAVRETVDRVLAVAAKGRTRWSRAILKNRLRQKMRSINNKHKKRKAKGTGDSRYKKPDFKKNSPALQRKLRVLGRIVPGCRKLSFPNLLEETTDYIAALEMQVRAITALTELLTSAGPSASHDWPVSSAP